MATKRGGDVAQGVPVGEQGSDLVGGVAEREIPALLDDMVDITRHTNQQLNAIPNDLQMRVKIRWDDDYFYVGAVLHENYVHARTHAANPHDSLLSRYVEPEPEMRC